jgi:hypothetical protein
MVERECAGAWSITDHVCQTCFGRVLRRLGEPVEYRCASCGAAGRADVETVCACGARHGNGRLIGLVCVPNPWRSPVAPAEIVVEGR